jgi:hypothetical protein
MIANDAADLDITKPYKSIGPCATRNDDARVERAHTLEPCARGRAHRGERWRANEGCECAIVIECE